MWIFIILIKIVLNFLAIPKQRISVLFDEYKSKSDLYKWPGASKAIDEFFTKNLDIKIFNKKIF